MSINTILGSLNQTITLYPAGVQNKLGKTTYSTGVDYSCRFQKTTKNIYNIQHEITPISAIVWLAADTPATINSKALFGADDYKIVSIEPIIDKYGNTRHLQLLLQDWVL